MTVTSDGRICGFDNDDDRRVGTGDRSTGTPGGSWWRIALYVVVAGLAFALLTPGFLSGQTGGA